MQVLGNLGAKQNLYFIFLPPTLPPCLKNVPALLHSLVFNSFPARTKLPHIQQELVKKMTAYFYLNKYYTVAWQGGGKWGHTSWAQVLGVQQHTLQLNQIVFLSRNLDQNIPKNGLFLDKK